MPPCEESSSEMNVNLLVFNQLMDMQVGLLKRIEKLEDEILELKTFVGSPFYGGSEERLPISM